MKVISYIRRLYLGHSPLGPGEVEFVRQSLERLQVPNAWFLGTESFSVTDVERLEAVSKVFEDFGIVSFPSNISIEALESMAGELFNFVDRLDGDSVMEDLPDFRLTDGSEPYGSLAASEVPVVTKRRGTDAGMVDIFNVDRLFKGIDSLIRNWFDESDTSSLVSKLSGKSLKLSNVNAYVNIGVQETRGFHVDSYGGRQFKVFLYLTDVLQMEDGPYCYVPGAHKQRFFESTNKKLAARNKAGATDVLAFGRFSPVACLGPRGSVIISNQSGAHRGLPQSKNGRRALLALNFVEER